MGRPRRTSSDELPHDRWRNVHYYCSCPECTEGRRERVRALRARRLAERVRVDDDLVAVNPNVRHGLYATYQNWGCRCVECRAATRERDSTTRVSRRVLARPRTSRAALLRQRTERRDYLARRVVERVHARVADPTLTVKSLSAELDISVHHLIAQFVDVTGDTPGRYILLTRMRHATELLTRTNLSVSEVAAQVGYLTREGFSVAFRKYGGVSPGTYRRRVRVAARRRQAG